MSEQNRFKQLATGLNAFTFCFDKNLLDELRALYLNSVLPYLNHHPELLEGGYYREHSAGHADELFVVSYDTFPLLWFSYNDALSFDVYQRFFNRLNLTAALKGLLDFKQKVVMYCGFFVIGDRAPEAMWHNDYRQGAEAFTLITPLFELDPQHGHLLYQLPDSQIARYSYQPGEAVILGDNFFHSTEPYGAEDQAGPLRVLVSLTFGSDKWQHWDSIRLNIENQSRYYALPCGHLTSTCKCEQQYRFKQKLFNYFKP